MSTYVINSQLLLNTYYSRYVCRTSGFNHEEEETKEMQKQHRKQKYVRVKEIDCFSITLLIRIYTIHKPPLLGKGLPKILRNWKQHCN